MLAPLHTEMGLLIRHASNDDGDATLVVMSRLAALRLTHAEIAHKAAMQTLVMDLQVVGTKSQLKKLAQ